MLLPIPEIAEVSPTYFANLGSRHAELWGQQCSKFLPTSDAVVVVPFMLGSIVSAAETQYAMVFQEG